MSIIPDARRIYLKAYRYNMHLCPKSLLIELGAQNNTEEEIHNACDVLAHVLDLFSAAGSRSGERIRERRRLRGIDVDIRVRI